jgi:FMN reductase
MRDDPAVYLDGRAVGSIVCAAGWQTIGTTLTTLRPIIHALRGWPTPLGVGLNTSAPVFNEDGSCVDEKCAAQLRAMADQVVEFANLRSSRASTAQLKTA